MMRGKKLISMLLMIAVILTMAGCGGGASSKGDKGTQGAPGTETASKETQKMSDDSQGGAGAPDGQDASGDKVTLTFWNNFTADDGEVLKQIVKEFNETNTKNIEVIMDIMPAQNLNEKLPLSISSGTGPDFFATGGPFFASLVENGAVKDLGSFWDYEGVDKNDFTQSSIDLMTVNNTQYFLPLQMQGFYLFWNKDLFEKAGLDPEKGPETWDEVWEYAEKIADSANNVWGFGIPVKPSDATTTFYNWLVSEGGSVFNEDYSEVTFNTDSTLAILDKIQEMIYEKKVGPESPAQADLGNLMTSGQLGMMVNGPWMNTGLRNNEINYGISVIPQGSTGQNEALLLGVGFGISSCTDDSKVDAIYEFFKYWSTTENCKRWSLECGFPPYLKSAINDSEVQADDVIATMSKQIGYAKPFMMDNSLSTVICNEIMNPMIESVILGEDTRTALDTAVSALEGYVR